MTQMNNDEDDKVVLYFMRHAQHTIADGVLPAMRTAIERMVDDMESEINIHDGDRSGLRQIATTYVVNQMVNYLQQDRHAERRHIDSSGQRTAADYDDLASDGAKTWFTTQIALDAERANPFWIPRWSDAFDTEG